MERFFDDSFERLLREKTDEFLMYPSRRVWSSLYNNLHPGSYWPSRAVSIALLSLLLVIGHLNSSQSSKPSKHLPIASTERTKSNRLVADQKPISSLATLQQVVEHKATAPVAGISSHSTVAPAPKSSATFYPTRQLSRSLAYSVQAPAASLISSGSSNNDVPATLSVSTKQARSGRRSTRSNPVTQPADWAMFNKGIHAEDRRTTNNLANKFNASMLEPNEVDQDSNEYDRNNPTRLSKPKHGTFSASLLPLSDRVRNKIAISSSDRLDQLRYRRPGYWPTEYELSYMEQHQLAQTRRRGFTQKLSWSAWGSPSLIYRNLTYSPLPPATQFSAALSPEPLNPEIERSVKQHASWGFEAGVGLKLELIRRVRLTAGLQANYTRYNLEAFENAHPVATTLTMNNRSTGTHYEVLRATKFSNGSGMDAVTLHNQTLQVSLPVGLEYRLAGRQRIQWYVGTSIQPTFLVNGKAYLISTDRRNYVEETGMLRRWNLNAGLETYVSYTGKNGLIWNVGPQFRRQLFSTNRSQYAVEEFLNGYGVKIGITKPIR